MVHRMGQQKEIPVFSMDEAFKFMLSLLGEKQRPTSLQKGCLIPAMDEKDPTRK
jgi:hypothetical protein